MLVCRLRQASFSFLSIYQLECCLFKVLSLYTFLGMLN